MQSRKTFSGGRAMLRPGCCKLGRRGTARGSHDAAPPVADHGQGLIPHDTPPIALLGVIALFRDRSAVISSNPFHSISNPFHSVLFCLLFAGKKEINPHPILLRFTLLSPPRQTKTPRDNALPPPFARLSASPVSPSPRGGTRRFLP